ncbi:MAG: hypothetical protein H0W25_08860 [Acidimicrobiia bacterium]|nr:hypothetical protein [Acidimicrobiia bacterium]
MTAVTAATALTAETALATTALAHQGGWDEVLLVLAPIGLFSLLLYIANRRAAQLVDEDEDDGAR